VLFQALEGEVVAILDEGIIMERIPAADSRGFESGLLEVNGDDSMSLVWSALCPRKIVRDSGTYIRLSSSPRGGAPDASGVPNLGNSSNQRFSDQPVGVVLA